MAALAGRTALVTGASRGIGRAAAVALARAGCRVAINYRRSSSEAEGVVQLIRDGGGLACSIRADVSREDEVATLVRETERLLGPVDILINNAGLAERAPLEEIGLDLWQDTIAANLTSAFLASQAVIAGMRARKWGRLVFISSVAAQLGGVIGPHYAASKAGMVGLMHSYSHLLAKDGITANALAPALVDTDMVRSNPRATPELIPIGRFGDVDEAAEAILFLTTNAYMTGQTVSLNGGWYMTS